MTVKTSKKDEMKKAIMTFLNNKVGAVARKEINEIVKDLGSDRTIGRALAELKLDGKVLQTKDGNTYSWTSTEPKAKDLENDYSEVTDDDSNDRNISDKPAHEKAELIATKADQKEYLDQFDKEWIAELVDKELTDRELKPTKKNIEFVKGLFTPKTMSLLEKHCPEIWERRHGMTDDQKRRQKKQAKADKRAANRKKKEKKEISKDQLMKAGKVNRNASGSGKKPAKKAGKKGPGVIATIIQSITKKHRTKKQILKILAKTFPEREPEKMMKTINVQVPSRLRKDKGLEIEKTEKGYKIISK